MDSPRGRIYLMKEGLQGEPMTPTMVRHFDLCLGCLACETACPSDVQYGKLIEATRQQVGRRFQRGWPDRLFRSMLFASFPYPGRLRALLLPLAVYQRLRVHRLLVASGILSRLPEQLRAMESLMPPVPRRQISFPSHIPPRGPQRARVGVLLGCVQRVFYPEVNAATVRVLAAEGSAVAVPARQGCCGALSLHAGREEEARRFARRIIDAFEPTESEFIIVNSAGCGSAMKGYDHLLRDDPGYASRARAFAQRVRDISEFLAPLEPRVPRHTLAGTVVYHDACHLSHGQGVRRQPRELLAQIPGLTIREVPQERDLCCGSAGIYNLVEPEPARALGERKARNVINTDAQILGTANPGCRLQIGASLARLGESLAMAHPIEVLDASMRARPIETLLSGRR
jgi:glycolate oxidase iron-sulfur subunit